MNKSKRKSKICIVCGAEFGADKPPSKIRTQQCCSHKCDGINRRNRGNTKPCLNCGKPFGFEFNEARLEQTKFCCSKCSNQYYRQADPSKRSIFICGWCGKEFEEWAYRQPRFCSRQCTSEYGARQPKPAARVDRIALYCEWCNSEYHILESYYNLRGSRFCSKKCRYESLSQKHMGSGNPNYSGGTKYPDRGTNWGRQRKKAYRRDNGKCQICGAKRDKKKNRFIDVHHIKPYAEFEGDYKRANKLSNLITLCRQCHVKVEKRGLPCPVRLL